MAGVKGDKPFHHLNGEDKWNRKYVRGVSFNKETPAGVKSAKLYAEQDQIGKHLSQAMTKLSG